MCTTKVSNGVTRSVCPQILWHSIFFFEKLNYGTLPMTIYGAQVNRKWVGREPEVSQKWVRTCSDFSIIKTSLISGMHSIYPGMVYAGICYYYRYQLWKRHNWNYEYSRFNLSYEKFATTIQRFEKLTIADYRYFR